MFCSRGTTRHPSNLIFGGRDLKTDGFVSHYKLRWKDGTHLADSCNDRDCHSETYEDDLLVGEGRSLRVCHVACITGPLESKILEKV